MTVSQLIHKLEVTQLMDKLEVGPEDKEVRFLVHWSDGRGEYKILSIQDVEDYVEIELSA